MKHLGMETTNPKYPGKGQTSSRSIPVAGIYDPIARFILEFRMFNRY